MTGKSNAKHFGDVVVKTARAEITDVRTGAPLTDERGRPKTRPVGTQIEHGDTRYVIPQWPTRVRGVSVEGQGLRVAFDSGSRVLDPAHDALVESKAGGSAGGHDPRAHGKIRYIVRAFGQWANGKQSVCVARIRTEHPEVAKGKNLDALCAWLKDQWAGDTKWRGKKSDPKQVAEDKAITSKARSTARARFTHSMPLLDSVGLDALVEDVRSLTGIEPHELLGRKPGGEVFEALWEQDVLESTRVLAVVESELAEVMRRGVHEPVPEMVETWFALWGLPRSDEDPATLVDAARRIVSGQGAFSPSSTADRRVMEAQMAVLAVPAAEEVVIEVPVPPPVAGLVEAAAGSSGAGVRHDRSLSEDPTVVEGSYEALFAEAAATEEGADTSSVRRELNGLSRNALGAIIEEGKRKKVKALCGHMVRRGRKTCPKCSHKLFREVGVANEHEVVRRYEGGDQEETLAMAERDLGYSRRESADGVELTHAFRPTIRMNEDSVWIEEAVFEESVEEPEPEPPADEPDPLDRVRQEARVAAGRVAAGLTEVGLEHVSGYTTTSGKKVSAHVRGGGGVRAKVGNVVRGVKGGKDVTGILTSSPGGKPKVNGRTVDSIDADLGYPGGRGGDVRPDDVGKATKRPAKKTTGKKTTSRATSGSKRAPARRPGARGPVDPEPAPAARKRPAVGAPTVLTAKGRKGALDALHDPKARENSRSYLHAFDRLSDDELNKMERPDLIDLANVADDWEEPKIARRVDRVLAKSALTPASGASPPKASKRPLVKKKAPSRGAKRTRVTKSAPSGRRASSKRAVKRAPAGGSEVPVERRQEPGRSMKGIASKRTPASKSTSRRQRVRGGASGRKSAGPKNIARSRASREANLEERHVAGVKPHIRTLPDGRQIPVSRHPRGVGGSRHEIRVRSEAVSKGNRTRGEQRRASAESPSTDDAAAKDAPDTSETTDTATEEALAAAYAVLEERDPRTRVAMRATRRAHRAGSGASWGQNIRHASKKRRGQRITPKNERPGHKGEKKKGRSGGRGRNPVRPGGRRSGGTRGGGGAPHAFKGVKGANYRNKAGHIVKYRSAAQRKANPKGGQILRARGKGGKNVMWGPRRGGGKAVTAGR